MKRTERTLAEQIQLHNMEFENRKKLLGFTQEDIYNLKKVGPRISSIIDPLVDKFYEQQTAIDDVELIIGDLDTLARLRAAQRQYIIGLFCGTYDMSYANNRLRIGLVHKRIGVEPKFYLSAMQMLKDLLNEGIYQIFANQEEAKNIVNSLEKLLMLDIQLVFDTYIRTLVTEVEVSKEKVENYAENLEQEVAQRTKELEELSQLDPLTNLYNRRAFDPIVSRDMANAKRQSINLSMLYIDIDEFKELNDTLGHTEGDRVLALLGSVLNEESRKGDLPCRIGGDEFLIFLMDANEQQAIDFGKRVIDSFSKQTKVTVSIGVSCTGPVDFVSAPELIQHADSAMYQAKESDGNQLVSYSSLEEKEIKPDTDTMPIKLKTA